jgi:hypothetical protein
MAIGNACIAVHTRKENYLKRFPRLLRGGALTNISCICSVILGASSLRGRHYSFDFMREIEGRNNRITKTAVLKESVFHYERSRVSYRRCRI